MASLIVLAGDSLEIKGLSYLKFLKSIKSDFQGTLRHLGHKHSPVIKFKLMGKQWYYFTTPKAVEYILKKNVKNFSKDFLRSALGPIMGEGILLTEGKRWAAQRRNVSKSFHYKTFSTLLPWITDFTQKSIQSFEDKELDFHFEMNQLILSISTKTFLGEDVDSSQANELQFCVPIYSKLSAQLLRRPFRTPRWFPLPSNLKMKDIERRLTLVADLIIEKRRVQIANGHTSNDALTLLLLNSKEVSQKELQHQVITFLAAGSETTANMLTWTISLLAQNPDIVLKLQSEIESVLGDEPLGLDHLDKLHFTNAIMQESMRIYPIVAGLGRQVVSDDTIEGVDVKAGSIVYVSQFSMHIDPKYWTSPMEFKPERFLNPDKTQDDFTAFFPFSLGPRVCVGESIALMFGKIVLTSLYRKHTFILNPDQKLDHQSDITLIPKFGLHGKLKPLSSH